MKKVTLASLLVFFYLVSFAQRGKTGSLTVSSTVIVNEYTTLTANASIGNTSITVASSGLNVKGRFSGNLSAGDLIMIIQMQGATINGAPNIGNPSIATPNDSTWGVVTNYNNSGNSEFAEVSSVPNGTTINLDCGLVNNYTSAGKVQVIRVPRYNSLTINNGGSIGCDAWDSATGGIVSVEVLNNTIINSGGKIDVSAGGFRGGQLDNDSSTYGVNNTASRLMSFGKEKGEGIAGYTWSYAVFGGRYGLGAAANAGGGSDAHNGGGGGGANGGIVSKWINGFGNPDISSPNYVLAWNLEYSWLSAFTASGGGRGGYTFSSASLDPTTNSPNNLAWGGDDRKFDGGRGGRPLDYSTGRLFIGGGGGAGDQDDNYAGAGGSGAGMVYLMSYGTVSGTGQILANGQNGVNAQGAAPNFSYAGQDGAGGGGAGGTIIVNSIGNISGITLQANGGLGGNQVLTKGNFYFGSITEAEGPGGGGGGGYIATSNPGPAETALGGANGTTNSPTMVKFPPNGATKGGAGTTGATITNFYIVAANDTICSGQSANLNASLIGNVPVGTTIEWYTTQTGGSSIASGPSYSTPALFANTTYYVGTCPGTYRQAITVIVNSSPVITISPPATICQGHDTTISATGGSAYSWTPASSLNNPNIASPIASPTVTTTYTVSITTSCGIVKDSVKITVKPAPVATISKNDTICQGGSATLTATGGTSYKWSTGATTSSIMVNPGNTLKYTVIVSNGTCSVKDSVTVTVNPSPTPQISGKDSICIGDSTTLTASGGNKYKWSTGATTSTIKVKPVKDSTYNVVVSNGNCKDSTKVTIIVGKNLVASITKDTTICAGNTVQLIATGGTSYLWTPPAGLSSTTISDPLASPANTTKYVVAISNGGCKVKDSVNITVNPAPPISINMIPGNPTDLEVTPAITYFWTPSAGLSCDNCQNPTASPAVTTWYYVTITDGNGCTATDSVLVTESSPTSNCGSVFVPNAFSPNGDGQNDVLYARGNCIQTVEFVIYDRWGNIVFKTDNINEGWDGLYAGKAEDAGTFVYYINALTNSGKTIKQKGNISLVR